jgi:thiol-disulfide isomerase/thioredoxin
MPMKNILALIFCLILTTLAFAQENKNEKAPSISLKNLKGQVVRLEDFKGKVVLINFWATWCAPCLKEIPELIKWQTEYQKQGLQIIGINYPPTNQVRVRSFIRQNKINYPILFGSTKTKALFDSTETMPYSVVIDKDGTIKARIEGIIYRDEFEDKIKPLLNPDIETHPVRKVWFLAVCSFDCFGH